MLNGIAPQEDGGVMIISVLKVARFVMVRKSGIIAFLTVRMEQMKIPKYVNIGIVEMANGSVEIIHVLATIQCVIEAMTVKTVFMAVMKN